MNIELTEFTFEYKLNKLSKLNFNPIHISQTKINIYYNNLFYYFEYLYQFILISNMRKENIVQKYKNSSYIPCYNDLQCCTIDPPSFFLLRKSAKIFCKFKRYLLLNKYIYNSIFSQLLKKYYYT